MSEPTIDELMFENTRLENALIALQGEYETLALSVGMLRQLIYHLINETTMDRRAFLMWWGSAEIYDAIMYEFGDSTE